MKYRPALLITVLGLCFLAAPVSGKAWEGTDSLPAAQLHYYGRCAPVENDQVELISSAAHFGLRFKGKECRIFAHLPEEGTHNYLQYELDGVYQKRIAVSGIESRPITITAADSGAHTVWIYKATEAHTGPILIDKVEGKKVRALTRPDAPYIEFIGNSITCGAAADPSETPCGAGAYHDQHNAYYAYGPRVARALGINFVLSSVSGIGVYRNWNSDGPTMPEVYEKTDFKAASSRSWDFSAFTPAIVSIALGTNDFSPGDGKKERRPFDPETFIDRYVRFVQQVRIHYPAARIVLLSGPVFNGERRSTLEQCLTSVKDKVNALSPSDKPVAVFFFDPVPGRGCTGHPSVEEHGVLAEQLIPFFRQLLQGRPGKENR